MQGSLWGMIAGAGIMVKSVLAILLAFSVLSWAIIIYKYRVIRKMEKESVAFLDFFWHKKRFTPIFEACVDYKFTPLAKLFAAGYNELIQLRMPKKESAGNSFTVGELDSIQRALKKAISHEISRLEKAVAFLATTGNTTPFIGLFGTVWGIMNSFMGIGLKGSASLAVVAPGISEALITTAMGLIAAIPAVVAYNHFVARINRMTVEMENFAVDFLNIVERELRKDKG
ncbi:MAG: protein TolQ [Deltaproteobacteria bacterium]|nr:protein TolQ [Deltaproteobacteria bacterium]